jgi:exopolysaccharide production protein ExoZ
MLFTATPGASTRQEPNMPATDHGGQLVSIQILRAAAALGVTGGHIVSYEFVTQYGLSDALPAFPTGQLGVDVFFVISGLVMVYTSEQYFGRARGSLEFFLRRLARIVPLYWATTTIILCYLVLHYHDLAAVNFTPMLVLASYLFIPVPHTDGFMAPVNGVGWTLNYEMFFYACFSVAVLFSRRIGVVLLALALLCFVGFNNAVPQPPPFGYWAKPIILEFVFGMMIGLALREGVRIPTIVSLAMVIAAIAVHIVYRDTRLLGWGVSAALIVGACALSTRSVSCTGPLCRALSFLGDASYALYLVHPIAITLPRRLFPHFIDAATHPWLYVALLLCITIAAAIVVHVAFERPTTRVLQRAIKSMIGRTTFGPPDEAARRIEVTAGTPDPNLPRP